MLQLMLPPSQPMAPLRLSLLRRLDVLLYDGSGIEQTMIHCLYCFWTIVMTLGDALGDGRWICSLNPSLD
jgi:hypothetical protein